MPKVPLVVHAPPELKERLQTEADAAGMSRSRYVVGLLLGLLSGREAVPVTLDPDADLERVP